MPTNPLESLFPASDTTSSKPKHAGGRPRIWTEQRALSVVDQLQTWAEADATNITLEMGLVELGYRPWLLANIASDHTDYSQFPHAVQSLKHFLHAKIANGALRGVYNSRFSQFYMSAQAGWAARVDNTIAHTGEVKVQHTGLTINFLEHQRGDSSASQQI